MVQKQENVEQQDVTVVLYQQRNVAVHAVAAGRLTVTNSLADGQPQGESLGTQSI